MVFDLTDEATIQKKAAISLRVTCTAETPNFRVELHRVKSFAKEISASVAIIE